VRALSESFCQIDIEYFPYDKQKCTMKFGGWSYNGFLLDVSQLPARPEDVIENMHDDDGKEFQFLQQGMDLSAFYP
jgi:nicotinic acetylcholine receptor, invertebrate